MVRVLVACRHPLCAFLGGSCSLSSGVSRGCRTGPRPTAEVTPELLDELRGLLVVLDPAGLIARPDQIEAAARLAAIVRHEARRDRNLVALARAHDLALEPELCARLARLCARGSGPSP